MILNKYTHLLNVQHQDYIKQQDPKEKTQLNHVTTKEHESMMEEINKAATYLVDNNIKTEHQILHSYKVNVTPQAVVKSLNDQCTKYHADIIERHLDQINNSKPVTLNHMEFHCPMKYLAHLQEHHMHNEYMPHNYISKTLNTLETEHQHQLQKQLELHRAKEYEMSGPSF